MPWFLLDNGEPPGEPPLLEFQHLTKLPVLRHCDESDVFDQGQRRQSEGCITDLKEKSLKVEETLGASFNKEWIGEDRR